MRKSIKSTPSPSHGKGTADAARPVLSGRQLFRTFGQGEAAVDAVRSCDVDLVAGRITAIMGPSGSGKSSLLHLLAGLDTPTHGEVSLEGQRLSDLPERERARQRARDFGFVLQRDNLIPSLNLRENVAAPLVFAGTRRRDAELQADEMLRRVGLAHRLEAWPSQVSGGEAQRAAVARACAGTPKVIFADEPTGALDTESGAIVLDLFAEMVRDSGAAALVVTHDPSVSRRADETLHMVDGVIAERRRG